MCTPKIESVSTHRLVAAALRVADVSMIDLEESGEFGTTDYTMTFKEVRLSPSY